MASLLALAWRVLLALALVTSPMAGLQAAGGGLSAKPGPALALPCHAMAMGKHGDGGSPESPSEGQCACDWSACCHGVVLPVALGLAGPVWTGLSMPGAAAPQVIAAAAMPPPTRPPIA